MSTQTSSTDAPPPPPPPPSSYKPRVLVIAGSDSSGGAGIEADQRVLALHSCYALTATTALTAQNTLGVDGIHAIPSAFILQSLETLWADIEDINVVKIGMLANASTVGAVSKYLASKRAEADAAGKPLQIVLDPVMKATTGAELLDGSADAVRILREKLLPIASIVTPNIPEAMLLLSSAQKDGGTEQPPIPLPPTTTKDLISLAEKILDLCGRETWVLVKGGHSHDASSSSPNNASENNPDTSDSQQRQITDVLIRRTPDNTGLETHLLRKPYVSSRNTHGTGCSLASAIAANLAHGLSMVDAVQRASRYVEVGIRSARGWKLGGEKGHGPIDHWGGFVEMGSGNGDGNV